jgi:adenylosuccinate synthase
VLNHVDYIDWSAHGMTELNELPSSVIEFIDRVEELIQAPVNMVGTGNRCCDLIDVQKSLVGLSTTAIAH